MQKKVWKHFHLSTTGNGLFADGREVCRWPENKPSADHRICRWQSRAIGKDILPTVQTSAKTGHRQSRSLPTAKPSANPSHRQILIFADGQAIGNVRPSAKLAQGRRRPTPADAVPFADGLAVRPSAKGKAMPTATAIGIDRPRGRLRSCRAHRLCRWLAIGKPTLPTALTCRRHSLNFFLFFQPIFFLVPSYIKYNPTSKVGTILSFLAIFR